VVGDYGERVSVDEEFTQRHGGRPEAVASAPGRVNLIGEHLDYNGGPVLPMALGYRTSVAVSTRSDGRLVVGSLQREDPVDVALADLDRSRVEGWAAYVAGVVWALEVDLPGLTVLVDGHVPLGAGLSSSAALECAVALAVLSLADRTMSGEDIVAACVRAENEYAGAATGSMDQTVAVFAEPDSALLVDFADGSRRAVPWEPDDELLVIDTRANHELTDGGYERRRRTCEAAAEVLGLNHLAEATMDDLDRLTDEEQVRRARHVVTETARVHEAVEALERRDWTRFGELLVGSHESLRDDFEVSCAELDVAVQAALDAGAVGARMTGGGFGGSAIALVPGDRMEDVRASVSEAFSRAGFDEPRFLEATTAGGPAELHEA
jgi:galactokinase